MFSQYLKFIILDYLDDAPTIRYFCQIFPELVCNDRYWYKKYNDKISCENLEAYNFKDLPGMIYTIFITELIRKQDYRNRQKALDSLLNGYGIMSRMNHWRSNQMGYYHWLWRRPFYNDLTAEQIAEYLLADYWLIDYHISLDHSTAHLRNIIDPSERYQLTMEALKHNPLPDPLPWLAQNQTF